MNVKGIAILITVLMVIAYALGHYTATITTNTKSETKVDETVKTDTHQRETITEKKSPDGSSTVVTVIDTVKDQVDNKDSDTKSQTVTVKGGSKINLSALVGTSIHDLGIPLYGISVSKEFVGPLTLGVFGLTNGTIGLSVGINF